MLEVISHVADNLKWKCRKLDDCSGIDGQFVFILQEQSGASMRPRSAELWLHIMSFISPLSRFFFIGKKLRGFKDCLIHLANPREAPPTSNCCFKASLFSQLCLKLSTNIWINRRLPACWRCFRNAANSLFSTAAFIQRPLSSVTLKKGRVLLGINQIPPQNWSGNHHDFNKIRAFRKLQLPWNIKQRSGQQGRTSSYLVIDKLSDGTAFFLKRLQVCKRDFHVPSLVPQTVWSVEGLWGEKPSSSSDM